MKKELVDLQPKLEQAKIDNTEIMKVNSSHHISTSTSVCISVHLYYMKCKHVFS